MARSVEALGSVRVMSPSGFSLQSQVQTHLLAALLCHYTVSDLNAHLERVFKSCAYLITLVLLRIYTGTVAIHKATQYQ